MPEKYQSVWNVKLTSDEIETFARDGAICLRNVFSSAEIDQLIQGVDKILQEPSQYAETLRAEGGSGHYFNDYCNWSRIKELKDFIYRSPAAEIAGRLMQSQVRKTRNYTLI